eukprot:14497323-Alexandrium_andersonii.AAC.1
MGLSSTGGGEARARWNSRSKEGVQPGGKGGQASADAVDVGAADGRGVPTPRPGAEDGAGGRSL